MYNTEYRILLWYLGTLFACLCPHGLQILSCPRAASALVCGLHVADIQEEFVAGKRQASCFCDVCLSKGGNGQGILHRRQEKEQEQNLKDWDKPY